MTEAEWLAAVNPARMLAYLKDRTTDRKRRLFGVAACRTVWDRFPTDACHTVVVAAERFADGGITGAELAVARGVAYDWLDLITAQNFEGVAWARVAVELAADPVIVPQLRGSADLLRDVVGNPFRPASADPAWLTLTAVAVARAIYDGRAFHDLPVLADALQDAGCDDAAVLEHCRGDGPHVRGCWVVDLVLGKQ